MDEKRWLDSITSLMLGGIASLALLALLSLCLLWAVGRPAHAAPETSADPTPTVYVPPVAPSPVEEV